MVGDNRLVTVQEIEAL